MAPNSILQAQIKRYRVKTYHTGPGQRLRSIDDAVQFIGERGLITFWPIKGIDLPSLWTAAAGDRPVAEDHDDPGHVTWGWKDALLPLKRVYYGKYLRGKATFASLDLLPSLYALSPRVADLDDFRLAYEAGHLTHEARLIGEALLTHGPLHTIELRKRAHLSSAAIKSRFDRALTDLQRGLWIVPTGTADAGAWHYAFIYELFDRWYKGVPGAARSIRLADARCNVLESCLRSIGAVQELPLARLLKWSAAEVRKTMGRLEAEGSAFYHEDHGWIHTDVA